MKGQDKTNDPSVFFKQCYGEMEEGWIKTWEQILASPVYAQAQGSLLDAYLSSQQAVQSNLKKQLENLNMPSKDDLARIAFQVIQTEQKVSELQKEMKQLKNVEAKLDLVLAELKTIKDLQQQSKSINEPQPVAKKSKEKKETKLSEVNK